ncbi:hypothetical protein U1Q18_007589 [Sarracenia purpurea var. burkii]
MNVEPECQRRRKRRGCRQPVVVNGAIETLSSSSSKSLVAPSSDLASIGRWVRATRVRQVRASRVSTSEVVSKA